MSDSTNPNRQPKGVPVGGQFATSLHSEPEIGIPGQTAGHTITTLEDWESIPVGKHVLVQYTGEEGSGPGEVVFIRDAETLRWDHGPYRLSGGANWDAVWDHQEGVVLLNSAEANARLKVHKAADLERSKRHLYEALEDADPRIEASKLKAAQEADPRPLGWLRRLWD